jgi:hypothetical protein
MKFNWGHGIFVFFTLFVSLSLYQLYASRKYMPDLVHEDYYLDDIHLKDYILKKNNVSNLIGFTFSKNSTEDSVKINIPHQNDLDVQVHFLSPLSKKEDIKTINKLHINNSTLTIPINQLRKGNWNIEVKWKDGGIDYLYEDKIVKV